MNWHNQQDDALDELLRAARWPEPQPEQLERLEQKWRRLTVERRRLMSSLAAAAAVLLPIAGIAIWRALGPDQANIDLEVVHRSGPPTIVRPLPDPAADEGAREPQYVRDPNVWEQALTSLHRHRMAELMGDRKPSKSSNPKIDPIENAVQRLLNEANLEFISYASTLTRACPRLEFQLRQRIAASENSTEFGRKRKEILLRLLGTVATPASLPLLAKEAHREDCPIEVLAAVARYSNVAQLAAQANEECSLDRKQLWFEALLNRRTGEASNLYLQLAGQPQNQTAAIQAARNVNRESLEMLFASMFSYRVAHRMIAAKVLGGLDDAFVIKRLAKMALVGSGRREALAALLHSSNPMAKQFIAYAQNDLALSPSVRAVSFDLLHPIN